MCESLSCVLHSNEADAVGETNVVLCICAHFSSQSDSLMHFSVSVCEHCHVNTVS